MPRPRLSATQLAEMIVDPWKCLADPRYRSEALCQRWLGYAEEQIRLEPRHGLALVICGVRLALRVGRRQKQRGIPNYCVLARAYAVLGSAHRVNRDFAKAARTLAKATEYARSCNDPDSCAEVNMRRAIVCAYQAQRSDGSFDPSGLATGLELVEKAIQEGCRPQIKARALNARAILRIRAGDSKGAAQDARRALELLDLKAWSYDHISATSTLVSALSRGSKTDRAEATEFLVLLRKNLPVRQPAVRARLLWAEALLHAPNRQRKGVARKRLDQAYRIFLRLGMRPEAIAAAADLARIDPAGAVPKLCADLLVILDPGPLREIVENLKNASLIERVDWVDQLRAAIQGSSLLPAPAWPAP